MREVSIFTAQILFWISSIPSSYAEPFVKLKENQNSREVPFEILNLDNQSVTLRNTKGVVFDASLEKFSSQNQQAITTSWSLYVESISERVEELNEALCQELFIANGNIWNEPIQNVAHRLHLPAESETPFTSSFRCYTNQDYLFAGANPKTVVVYGDEKGGATSISAIYSNKGDTLSQVGSGEDHFKNDGKIIDPSSLEGAMLRDALLIEKCMTSCLGKPVEQRMLGQGNRRNKVKRWDWNSHSFLLTHLQEEYVSFTVVKTKFADQEGKFSRTSDAEIRARLLSTVQYESNSDVFIKHIPMVDQGPKGYCAPATFERAMRHAGVPSDMYLLATLATKKGGGTNTDKLFEEVSYTTRSKGGRTAREITLKSLSPAKIKKYIDKGTPILWQMCSLPDYNTIANVRTKVRQNVKDWGSYSQKISEEALQNIPLLKTRANLHLCMIIGYNESTNEIAVSDSWGPNYQIRWIHMDEAEAVSTGKGYVIDV